MSMPGGPPSLSRDLDPLSLGPDEDTTYHARPLLRAGHEDSAYEPKETALSRPSSLSLAATDPTESSLLSPASRHQRQRSVPGFMSRHLNTPPLSPTRSHSRQASQGMSLTGDGRGGTSPNRLTGWLSGASTPASSVDSDGYIMPMQSSRNNTARASVETTPKSNVAQSRLSFLASSVSAFTSRMTASPTQQAPPIRSNYDGNDSDDLCDLDIEAALFPPPSTPLDSSSSSGSSSDAFSPAAYKNFQVHAVGLLHKMQDAYRARTAALREMRAEREARGEEIEEAELRAGNFKSQLEKMAAKAAENEKAMRDLVAELRAERRARHEEREKMMLMFRAGQEQTAGGDGPVSPPIDNEGLLYGDERKQRWRKSDSSSTLRSEVPSIIDTDGDIDDHSISTGAESESMSIFSSHSSSSRSPTVMTCITENESLTPNHHDHQALEPSPTLHPRSAAASKPRPTTTTTTIAQSQPQQQLTTFQRLVKGMSPGLNNNNNNNNNNKEPDGGGGGGGGCRNCRGQSASMAWDTVSLLRDENTALKRRVAHLESVVEGALDLVNGINVKI